MHRIIPALVLAMLIVQVYDAYGHGQGLDTISGVRIDGKKLSISVEMPLAFEGGREQITISATEDITGEAARNITYLVGLFHKDDILFRNYFFAADGSLELEVTPSDGEIRIHGVQDDLLGAWSGDPVLVTGPVLESGGLYRFEIEVRTVDDPANIIQSDVYEADVSVAQTHEFGEFAIRSYFDEPRSLVHGDNLTFEMPFDWSEKKISHIPVVHVEVIFPKGSAFDTPGYEGYVNDQKLFKASVSIDDYSRADERTVHFILLEEHLRSIKSGFDDLPDVMQFELRPTQTLEFPLSTYTKSEEFEVNLSWAPREIEPGIETDFIFTIRDGSTGEPLRNSAYTFVLISGGEEIHRVSGIAQIGGDFERFAFSEDHSGPVIVRFEDIRGTGQETEFGIVVVPEFAYMVIVLGAGLAGSYVISRRALRYPSFC